MSGIVIQFDLSPLTGKEGVVVVKSATLQLKLRGEEGKVKVVQSMEGGGSITLDQKLLETGDGELELEVGHAVQGWLLEPGSNLGLEVLGDIDILMARIIINSQVKLNLENYFYWT